MRDATCVPKGGSASIPTLKGGVFPLRPLHPRRINPGGNAYLPARLFFHR